MLFNLTLTGFPDIVLMELTKLKEWQIQIKEDGANLKENLTRDGCEKDYSSSLDTTKQL